MVVMEPRRPPAPPPPNTVGIHVRIPETVEARLRQIAAEGYPYSYVVRWVLEEGLKALDAA